MALFCLQDHVCSWRGNPAVPLGVGFRVGRRCRGLRRGSFIFALQWLLSTSCGRVYCAVIGYVSRASGRHTDAVKRVARLPTDSSIMVLVNVYCTTTDEVTAGRGHQNLICMTRTTWQGYGHSILGNRVRGTMVSILESTAGCFWLLQSYSMILVCSCHDTLMTLK